VKGVRIMLEARLRAERVLQVRLRLRHTRQDVRQQHRLGRLTPASNFMNLRGLQGGSQGRKSGCKRGRKGVSTGVATGGRRSQGGPHRRNVPTSSDATVSVNSSTDEAWGFEEGSYFRLIDFVYYSNLGVIKKKSDKEEEEVIKKKTKPGVEGSGLWV